MSKGEELAELLRDIMSEQDMPDATGEVSEETIFITAQAIQLDIDNGVLVPDEEGRYYNPLMPDLYGELIERDLEG